jgi:hypothetical protein
VIGLTLPVALGWGAVLSGVAAGVHIYNQKNAEKMKSSDEKAEVIK